MFSCLPDSFQIWKQARGGGVTTMATTTELETTTSTCTTETVRRKHVFNVQGYSSLLSHVGVGSFIRSDTFEVGGYDWAVRYFPRGDSKQATAAKSGCVSAFAVLLTPGAEARASCDLTLVSRRRGVPSLVHRTEPGLLRHAGAGTGASDLAPCMGSSTFVKTSKLEEMPSPYVHDDCLRIECVVTVFKFKKASRHRPSPAAAATPSLSQDLVRLLETKEGADVSFSVEGEVFAAHAIVLAMRSPVFKAQLYGPMKEKTDGGGHHHRHISVVDMNADLFRALLHFIYTDTLLPGLMDDDLVGRDDGSKEFVKHLLVAADRYDVRGLKFICEKSVCESLTIATVASMFALADQHNCSMLQDACVDFITGSDTWADVMASEGYRHLRSLCPNAMIDLFEKATKSSHKNHHACLKRPMV